MFLWENGHIHFSSNIGKKLSKTTTTTHTQDSSMPRATRTLRGVKDIGRCPGNTKPGSCCNHNHPQVTVIVRREAGEHGMEQRRAVGPACWDQERNSGGCCWEYIWQVYSPLQGSSFIWRVLVLKKWFSTGGNFAPHGTFGNA